MGRVAAVVLGAGSGVRLGGPVNKIYLAVAGTPILVHAARAFAGHPEVDELHVVAAPAELARCRATLEDAGVRAHAVLAGGAARHDSELAAVDHLAARIDAGEVDLVLIHDGARPLVGAVTISRAIAAARADGAAVPALRQERALAVVRDGVLVARREPAGLWRAQTPQAFDARLLRDAFARARAAGFAGSDTAMTFERLGLPVRLVPGEERNFKVTYPIDLARAEAVAASDEAAL